jgi:NAD(P)-dependent dehydrogenase (short-subunit alcohol dehydrogenase family)
MAAALMISEFARRHIDRGGTWGRIIGLTSGGDLGFPEEVSYGAAKAAQTNYTMSAAVELAPFGVTANMIHPPVTDTGWVTDAVREAVTAAPTLFHVASPDQVARGDRLSGQRRRRTDQRQRDHASLTAVRRLSGQISTALSGCCHGQDRVADPDLVSLLQPLRSMEAAAVEEGAVRRAEVFDVPQAVRDEEARVVAGGELVADGQVAHPAGGELAVKAVLPVRGLDDQGPGAAGRLDHGVAGLNVDSGNGCSPGLLLLLGGVFPPRQGNACRRVRAAMSFVGDSGKVFEARTTHISIMPERSTYSARRNCARPPWGRPRRSCGWRLRSPGPEPCRDRQSFWPPRPGRR